MAENKIFVSYRRQDASGEAGRLVDHLREVFGDESVFLDVETIEAGIDFEQAIQKALNSCKVLLAIIGPHWIKIKDSEGNLRLFNEHDFIRIEVAAALQREIRVVPVLVNDAKMPTAADLPDELQGLTRRHAHELSSSRWKYDCDQLTEVLKKMIPQKVKPTPIPIPQPKPLPQPKPTKNWWTKNYIWVLLVFVVLVLIGLIPDESTPIDDPIDEGRTQVDPELTQEEINNLREENPDGNEIFESLQPEDERSSPPTAQASFDYSGKWWLWQDGVRMGYILIKQNGYYFNFDYYYFDQKTGEGTGEYDGTYLYSTLFRMYGDPNNYGFSFGSNDGGKNWYGQTFNNSSPANAELRKD